MDRRLYVKRTLEGVRVYMVAEGRRWIMPNIFATDPLAPTTERDAEVSALMAGYSTREVAEAFNG